MKRLRTFKTSMSAHTPLKHEATILDLKRGWTGIKIAKMANDHCWVPLRNNGKRYDSGKDLSIVSCFENIIIFRIETPKATSPSPLYAILDYVCALSMSRDRL